MTDRTKRETTERWYWDVTVTWPGKLECIRQIEYRLGDTTLEVLLRVAADAARSNTVDLGLAESVSCRLVKP